MSLVKEIKNWMLPQETAIPYRILTGITKGAEIATILISLGAAGISAYTDVFIGSAANETILVGTAALMTNKIVDSIATTKNRTRRAKQV